MGSEPRYLPFRGTHVADKVETLGVMYQIRASMKTYVVLGFDMRAKTQLCNPPRP